MAIETRNIVITGALQMQLLPSYSLVLDLHLVSTIHFM